MDKQRKSGTPRSSSKPKRSTMNLSDLRLAPLTVTKPDSDTKTSHDDTLDASFTRSHSSYLQGRSAPTTPGILSRSSSRKHLGGGLSRRGSLYDNDVPTYEYAGVVRDDEGGVRIEVGSGQIPKAKSEAALLVERNRLAAHGVPRKKQKHYHSRTRTGGSNTPRVKSRLAVEDDWLTRTGAATSAMLQETKGQSWLASRESSTSLTHLQDTTDEEDEGYEEMAALSTTLNRRQLGEEELSPINTRVSLWGSRYGSRTVSRRTSRRGSTTGSRTPIATAGGDEGLSAYYDDESPTFPMGPDFVDPEEANDEKADASVAGLIESHSFGLGGIVDRLMNFNLFKVEETETEDEADRPAETEAEAKQRMAAENERKRAEKETLVNRQADGEHAEGAAQGEGGWADAAWLLSVASKAIF